MKNPPTQVRTAPVDRSKTIKIGLALSGGGTRGVAHIGAIRALLEHGIEPTCIVGTSAGAVVGAMYAAGRTPDEMLAMALEGDSLVKMFKFVLPFNSVTSLENLERLLLKSEIPDTFSELKHDLTIAVTNFNRGCPEFLRAGSLHKAVTASCAIPLIFRPVTIGDELYADGGIFDNLPAHKLPEDCDIKIGIDLMPIVQSDVKSNSLAPTIAKRTFELIVYNNTSVGCDSCTHVITPTKLAKYHTFTFGKFQLFHDIGYEATLRRIPEIRAAMQQVDS